MAAKKLYDLAVKTGEYTNRDGDTKGRYENIGSILEMQDGGKMILLKRTFNPAGVPHKDGSDQIIVSMFGPKEQGQSSGGGAPSGGGGGGSAGDDDIQF